MTTTREVLKRDKEIIQALADGQAPKEIAAACGLSLDHIRTRVQAVRHKHKLKTTCQVVAHFVRNGWID